MTRLVLAVLAGFHLCLLGSQVMHGGVLDPAKAFHWVLASFVLLGFRTLRRRRLSLFNSRRALVLWLVVLFIHGHAVWLDGGRVFQPVVSESLEALARIAAPLGAVLGVLAAALLVGRGACRTHNRPPDSLTVFFGGLPATGCPPRFSPRPPPAG